MNVTPLEADVAQLGESPLWSPAEQVLFWVDVTGLRLNAFSLSTKLTQNWSFERPVAAVALARSPELLLTFRSRIALFDRDTGRLRELCRSSGDERFNDGVCDRNGRFWVGTFDRFLKRPLGALYCLEGNVLRCIDRGFSLSNGIAWSPDDAVLYFTDTVQRKIFAYDYDIASAGVSNRRVFASFDTGDGRPDGCVVDARGCLWTALSGGGAVVCLSADGTKLWQVDVPVSRPTSCTFGGADLRTIFVTSMRERLDAARLASEPLAGRILAVTGSGAVGLPETPFEYPA